RSTTDTIHRHWCLSEVEGTLNHRHYSPARVPERSRRHIYTSRSLLWLWFRLRSTTGTGA
ncbi:MAG: hypothetical protein O3C46_05640, partial [Bacteroidetes bacterium]|nr:hypothetical protein [Bacteroidota bacterium]